MTKHLFRAAMCAFAVASSVAVSAGENIRITTDATELVLHVDGNGRLYQLYYGEKLRQPSDCDLLPWAVRSASGRSVGQRGWEVCAGSGNESYYEPAVAITHSDGNPSTYLYYVSSATKPVAGGTQTDIVLRDDHYPVTVTLHYVAYEQEDVMKAWSEITHEEKTPVTLTAYASTMLYFDRPAYYLTEFSGDWAKEAQVSAQQLQAGKKVVDSKLGSRSAMLLEPFFELGLGSPVEENRGEVLMGTLGWTGNFRFTFEIDSEGILRVVPAINPYASAYELAPGEVFATPEFIFTLSQAGAGEGSRNLHDWARNYGLDKGTDGRMTLLNNWESTGFDFDTRRLGTLMGEAAELGVDLFLLDDGWFGNKHPRNGDTAGLGDWEANAAKLPGGIPALVDTARAKGVRFGLWIEPEMVNPKSELFEEHPDWAILNPSRKPYYARHQLVLDMSNPEVQDHVFGVVDKLMTENPEIAYFKWDCNSVMTNVYSPYLGERQGQLYIDYVRGLYAVLERIAAKYPRLQMMLCSGGGGRCDYGALKYFGEFWCSDNTDPVERLYIQWGFSQFFPAKALCAHVTGWNPRASIKFRTDVASMCKLGFDISLERLSEDERAFCRQAVEEWKSLAPSLLDGDLYRLVSPYGTNHMAVSYVGKDLGQAVLFAYDIYPRYSEKLGTVRLQGLDPGCSYRVEEVNLMPGEAATLPAHGKTLTGDFLMKVGLDVFTHGTLRSRVVKLTAL